jgi:hypothetical protein
MARRSPSRPPFSRRIPARSPSITR